MAAIRTERGAMKKTVMILALLATTSVAAQTPIKTSTWWFLMNEGSQLMTATKSAKVMGPYASQELCRLVARQQLPNDRRFLTAEERRGAETGAPVARDQRAARPPADHLHSHGAA